MLRTKHRKHQKRHLNYIVKGVSTQGDSTIIVDFESRENGSVYLAFWEVGMKVHIDFHYDHDTRNTAGTTITPLL
jgi:hypothetical protein